MTRIRTKKFGKYKAELTIEPEEDNRPYTYCHIDFENFSGSLACVSATGELTDSTGREVHIVPQETAREIEIWAEDNGY